MYNYKLFRKKRHKEKIHFSKYFYTDIAGNNEYDVEIVDYHD